jgi:2',3'-cyclic-nucleotide 2'-phosphodiesterase (5'-nucleotidase family)
LKKLCLFSILCVTGFYLYAAQLVVLNTTDLHGRIDGPYSGLLQIASLIEKQRKLYPADSILLIDCGDTIQGTFSSVIFKGRLMVKCLNYLKYDVWIPGNHDFDYGPEILKKRLREFSGSALAANLESKCLGRTCGSWKMFERNGLKIAVIGATEPHMKNLSGTLIEALKRVMPEVRKAAPDIIILAQHYGMYGKDFSVYKLTAEYPEINLILGAHSHQTRPGERLSSGAWYFQAGRHACGLGKILIDYDEKTKKITRINSELIPVTKNTPADRKLLSLLMPDLKYVKKLAEEKITTINFKNTAELDSSFAEQRIIGAMMLNLTGADVAVSGAYPSRYKLSGKVEITPRRLYYWSRFEDTVCTLTVDKAVFKKIIAEQKKFKKSKYHTIISYADEQAFKQKKRISAAFNSYTVSGAGGKFPFLRGIAENPEYQLKDTGVIIRGGLEKYLKGNPLTVTKKPDGKIVIEEK